MRRNKSLNTVYAVKDKRTGQPTGKYAFRTPAGSRGAYPTKKAAELAKSTWTPTIGILVRDAYMKKGDKVKLCFSGYYDNNDDLIEIPLIIEGVKRNTTYFSYSDGNGTSKVKSLMEIKKAVAEKKGTPSKVPALNPNRTIHEQSNKSITDLKKQYVEDFRSKHSPSPFEEPQQLNFLDAFADASPNAAEGDFDENLPVLPAALEPCSDILSEFKEEVDAYFKNQIITIQSIKSLSDKEKLKLCKANVISMLSM